MAGLALLLSGCPDTEANLDEFVAQTRKNLPDGGAAGDAGPTPDGGIQAAPDITGTYLLSVAPFGDPNTPLLFRANVTAAVDEAGQGTFEMVLFPVTTADKQVLGDARIPAEGTITGGTIAPDGTLAIDLGSVVVPGPANALSGAEIEATLRLTGRATSTNQFCGDLEGSTSRPAAFELTGSTFGVTKLSDDFSATDAEVTAAAMNPITECVSEEPRAPAAPDITGTYLLGVAPFGDPNTPLLFRADVDATADPSGAATFEMVLFPVTTADKQVLDDARIPAQGAITGGTLTASGALEIDLGSVVVPGPANALSGAEIEATLRLIGRALSTDVFCGDLEGATSRPAAFELTGSTFGVIKLSPDHSATNAQVTEAAAAPVTACP